MAQPEPEPGPRTPGPGGLTSTLILTRYFVGGAAVEDGYAEDAGFAINGGRGYVGQVHVYACAPWHLLHAVSIPDLPPRVLPVYLHT